MHTRKAYKDNTAVYDTVRGLARATRRLGSRKGDVQHWMPDAPIWVNSQAPGAVLVAVECIAAATAEIECAVYLIIY